MAERDASKERYFELRKIAILAMFTDDVLFNRLVLKGGNALDVVLGMGGRTSIDVDFSIEGDFDDLDDIKRRVQQAIEGRFDSAGFSVVDFTFERKPGFRRPGMPVEWGGYRIEFKIIRKAMAREAEQLGSRGFTLAENVGPGSLKTMTIEISHHEYTQGRIEKEVDHELVVVYTPSMIAIEKLRAICQQMPEYTPNNTPVPRAKDFYDIYRLCEIDGVRLDSEECGELLVHMFAAKVVPLELLQRVGETRDFHVQSWPEVVDAARERLSRDDFGKYVDYVVRLIGTLKLPRNE